MAAKVNQGVDLLKVPPVPLAALAHEPIGERRFLQMLLALPSIFPVLVLPRACLVTFGLGDQVVETGDQQFLSCNDFFLVCSFLKLFIVLLDRLAHRTEHVPRNGLWLALAKVRELCIVAPIVVARVGILC